MARWFLLLILLLTAFPAHASAQEGGDWTLPYRAAMLPDHVGDMAHFEQAPRYEITMTLHVTSTSATLTGQQTVTYTNRASAALTEIVFRLYPNLPSYGGQMDVSHIQVDGTAARPKLDATRSVLSIALPTPLEPGLSVTLDMEFSIEIQEGHDPLYAQFSYVDGVLALPNAYPVLSVYEETSGGWWRVTEHPQGDAVYSETAFYQVTLTAPEKLVIASSGSEVEMVENGDGSTTHHLIAPLMRDFYIAASDKYYVVMGEQDGITVSVYYYNDQEGASEAAAAGLQMTQDAVRIYNATFGPYPFSELDVVETPTTAGGIEYPGVFVVAANTWDEEQSFFEFVIAHEAAHEWWYSLVGNDQTLDPWMDEALAQYAVAVYIRDLEGADAYDAALEFYAEQYVAYISNGGEDTVIGLPVSAYNGSQYYYMVYEKGPLFYVALDDLYGYEMVIRMLQVYFEEYRYEITETDDMLASFEATLGQDLDSFFEEWVGAGPVGRYPSPPFRPLFGSL
ncbi:MAG TPA: M1 family metallopeptidase [Aggregatilineaceae bacterium]|nr:M1 family metallopeptidase [Aggregatilineaceae bacterium]